MKQKITILFIVMLLASNIAFCSEYQTKDWMTATVIGSFSQNQNLKYYIEPQLRFIDNQYIFNQAFFLAGLGYQLTPTIAIFGGPGIILIKNDAGQVYQEYRFWQQLNWLALNNSSITLNSRTRFEEKKLSNQSQVALQMRQRLWLRIPIPDTSTFYYSTFDEVFFNFNHPSWTSPKFFEQNRAFIGIGKQCTKYAMVDFGYLNQLQFGLPRRISNVVLIVLSFNVS